LGRRGGKKTKKALKKGSRVTDRTVDTTLLFTKGGERKLGTRGELILAGVKSN